MDPEGHKFKSSKDVEGKLEADGILDQFVNENSPEIFDKQASTSKTAKDSDEDCAPPVKKKAVECLDKFIRVSFHLFVLKVCAGVFISKFKNFLVHLYCITNANQFDRRLFRSKVISIDKSRFEQRQESVR